VESVLPAVFPVLLAGGEEASGLADMLHQYLSQNIADSPEKLLQARRLQGEVVFRAAEDEEVSVRIHFRGDGISVEHGSAAARGAPNLTTDFISVAHLTTGEEGPFALLLRRKMRVSFSPGQMPFLVQVLRFMQVPPEFRAEKSQGWKWWALGVGAAAAAGGAYWAFYLQ